MADETTNAQVIITGVDNTGQMAQSVANNFKQIAQTAATVINQGLGTPIKQVTDTVDMLGQRAQDRIGRGVVDAFKKAGDAANTFMVGMAGGLTAGLVEKVPELIKKSVEKFADAETAMIKLRQATGATAAQAAELEEKFFSLSEKTGQGVETLAGAFIKLKTVSGLSLEQATELFPQVAQTAFTTRTSIEDVGKAVSYMSTQMHMSNEQISTMLDGWTVSLQDVGGEFSKMFAEAAPLMERLGMTGEKATAAYQAMFHVLQQGFSEAGMNEILKQANQPGSTLFGFVQQHMDAIKQSGEGAKGVMDELVKELERIPGAFGNDATGNMIMHQFFGDNEQAKATIKYYREHMHEITEELHKQETAAGATGKAMKAYAESTTTAINELGVALDKTLKALGGSMPGQSFLHALRDELNEVTRAIQEVDKFSLRMKEKFGGTLTEKERERLGAPSQPMTREGSDFNKFLYKINPFLPGGIIGNIYRNYNGGGGDAASPAEPGEVHPAIPGRSALRAPGAPGYHPMAYHPGEDGGDATKQNTSALYKLTDLLQRIDMSGGAGGKGGFINAAYTQGAGGAGGGGSGGWGSAAHPNIPDPLGRYRGGGGRASLEDAARSGGGNAGAKPMGQSGRGDPRGMEAYIRATAQRYGIDPDTAVAVARSEGLGDFSGDRGTSFGAFQLHKDGGLGDDFQKQTGLDPADKANEKAGIDYALQHAAKNGWGAFHGARNTGIGQWQGIGGNSPRSNDPHAMDPMAPAGAGIVREGLTTIRSKNGKEFKVAAWAAPNFQRFIDSYEEAGGKFGPNTGTLGTRGGNASYHPLARAIDVNQIGRGVRGGGVTLPREVEDKLADDAGLWPGSRFGDAGHFEVRNAAHALALQKKWRDKDVARTTPGEHNQLDAMAQRHQQLRQQLEAPIKLNISAPDNPQQLGPYRQRVARQQVRWHSEDQLGFHRNSVASDIGIG